MVAGARLAPEDLELRSRSLAEAVSLWRGTPLLDVPSERLQAAVPHLVEDFLQAWEQRIEVDRQLGRLAEHLGVLKVLTREHPLLERFWSHLMLALHESGRQGEALEVYRTATTILADELGVGPGAELRATHQAVLAGSAAVTFLARDLDQ